ncbi:ABC transporter permease [Fusibacter sp. 3D3]|uniref:ABC transporter permease n=1 Tax=Fusibacter sp. 3D3 TaxID=1048380 RepID=UPI000853A898|nr:ABC transporter permease [Fusibacter sp. 3D3]GAU79253.1 ABC-type multidrug transport system permease component [Fusibacter sp. 3D3]
MRPIIKKYLAPLVLIILIPQLTNWITCQMMSDKQLREIPMAVYLGDDTSLTREIVRSFDENETFEVKYYAESPQDIEALMTEGKIYFGLSIPVDFTKDMKGFKSPTINTVIDGSQLSLASFTKLRSSEILLTIKTGAMVKLYQGKYSISENEALHMAMPIAITTRLAGNPTRNYINFLLTGMMAALVQVGLVMNAAAVFTAQERKLFSKNLWRYLSVYSGLAFISIMSIILVQSAFFSVPVKGNLSQIMILTAFFAVTVTSVGLMIASAFSNKVFATQVGAVWFIPSSIVAGYTWPTIAMPTVIQNLSKMMPFTYYGDALRDLLLKGTSHVYSINLVKLFTIYMISLGLAYFFNRIRTRFLTEEDEHDPVYS